MGLTRKIAILQIVVVICFISGVGLTSQWLWGNSYLQLEQQEVKENMTRAHLAWQEEVGQLDSLVGDWAPWDELYAFAANPKNDEFIDKNLNDQALANLKLNAVLILDPSGAVLFTKAMDLERRIEKPVPSALAADLASLLQSDYLAVPPDQSRAGFIFSDGQPVLFAMQRILTSHKQGPSAGVLIFARYADEYLLRTISTRTQIKVGFVTDFSAGRYTFGDAIYQNVCEDRIQAFLPLNDAADRVYALTTTTPRNIVKQGQEQTRLFLMAIVIFGSLLAGLTLWLLDRMVLAKLRIMHTFMNSIIKEHDYSVRMSLPGGDEVSQAAEAMNGMLARIEQSETENKRLLQSVQAELQERKKVEESLRYISLHDSLTGLYNRSFFEAECVRLVQKKATGVGIVCCDVDGLKLVNDTMGHLMGDRLLARVAKLLRATFGDNAVIARIGGDEFVILLASVGENDVQQKNGELRERVESEPLLAGDEMLFSLSMSIGWAYSGGPVDVKTIHDIFRQADDNMYRQKLSNSQSSQNKLVQGMLKLLKVRDFITEGHSQRLQQLVVSLGKTVGLDERQLADLCLLAQFHDIGKVGIPDSILLKPARLTPEERKEMERHSEIGCRIAQSIPELLPISDFILKHHEWWDGSGYPQHLSGEAIPIEDRILALADAYDAMTNDRPYRQAMTAEDALAEIRRMAGRQFDPALTERFIVIIRSSGLADT